MLNALKRPQLFKVTFKKGGNLKPCRSRMRCTVIFALRSFCIAAHLYAAAACGSKKRGTLRLYRLYSPPSPSSPPTTLSKVREFHLHCIR